MPMLEIPEAQTSAKMESRGSVFVVMDSVGAENSPAVAAKRSGYEVVVHANARSALAAVRGLGQLPDVMVCGLQLDSMSGIDFIAFVHELHPELPIVAVTRTADVELTVGAMRRGAFDVLSWPSPPAVLESALARGMGLRRRQGLRLQEFGRLEHQKREVVIGDSPGIRRIYDLVERVAESQATILITGESGTGKEIVARGIHERSPRHNRAFIAVTCGALPESLLEAELFGYERGAFTGADRSKPGRFELADGGTIFLDEIGDIPLSMQVKLLRFLQEREFERLGGTETLRSDVRVLAATHRNLSESVREGSFRADLYYRLAVVSMNVPPLRERADEIPRLAAAFVQKFSRREGCVPPTIAAEAMCRLSHYDWPGNVRELENAIERAVILSGGHEIAVADLPDSIVPSTSRQAQVSIPLGTTLREAQDLLIAQTLRLCQGDKRRAAQFLGTSTRTITRHCQDSHEDPCSTAI